MVIEEHEAVGSRARSAVRKVTGLGCWFGLGLFVLRVQRIMWGGRLGRSGRRLLSCTWSVLRPCFTLPPPHVGSRSMFRQTRPGATSRGGRLDQTGLGEGPTSPIGYLNQKNGVTNNQPGRGITIRQTGGGQRGEGMHTYGRNPCRPSRVVPGRPHPEGGAWVHLGGLVEAEEPVLLGLPLGVDVFEAHRGAGRTHSGGSRGGLGRWPAIHSTVLTRGRYRGNGTLFATMTSARWFQFLNDSLTSNLKKTCTKETTHKHFETVKGVWGQRPLHQIGPWEPVKRRRVSRAPARAVARRILRRVPTCRRAT